jgi:hypothetical protein
MFGIARFILSLVGYVWEHSGDNLKKLPPISPQVFGPSLALPKKSAYCPPGELADQPPGNPPAHLPFLNGIDITH